MPRPPSPDAPPPPPPPKKLHSLLWAWVWVAALVLGLIALLAYPPEGYRLAFGWVAITAFLLLPLMMFYDYERRTNARVLLMPSASKLRRAMPKLRQGNPVWLIMVRLLVLALLILSAARPQMALGEEKDITQGIDLVLALDVSGSMLAEDMLPNRLVVAKKVVQDFIAGSEGNRLGLVAFAGRSLTQVPVTTDYAILQQAVAALEIGSVQVSGTAIGDAIGNSINKFQDPKAKSKVVILLTDGENNEGSLDPREAAKFAAQRDIKVYTIGVGTPGGSPIPNPYYNYGYRDQPKYLTINGQVALTKLDEPLLRDIASTTGGRYYLATDEAGLRAAYDEIAHLEKHEIEIHTSTSYKELFPTLALLAMGCLILEVALATSRYRSFV